MYNYTDAFALSFWAKVDRRCPDECWPWRGRTGTNGHSRLAYGIVGIPSSIAGKYCERKAHRISYELAVGPIPDKMEIDHICHNPQCVNPRHLRVVTRSQNMQNLSGPGPRNTSGIRGVSWNNRGKKWMAQARVKGVLHYAGSFTDLEDAARAAAALRNRLMTHNDLDRKGV